MSTLYIMQMASLFAGDDDPTKAHFVDIEGVKLPDLTEKTKDFMPGGGVFGLSIGMRMIEPFKLTFKLHGLQPDVMSKMGINSPSRRKYTVRGNIVDIRTGEEIGGKAIIEGRLIKTSFSEFKREEGIDMDYEVGEVTHYEMFLGTTEKYYFDFFGGPGAVRIDGVASYLNSAVNLGIA